MRGFLVLIVLALLSVPAAAEAPAAPTGKWSWGGEAREVQKMEQTVDAIVDEMNMFIRPIARPRLKKEGKHWKRLAIAVDDTNVTIEIDGKGISTRFDQQVEPKDGLKLVRTMRGNVLVETYKGEKGGRTNEYHPTDGGLRVVSKIFAPQLPRPFEFTYTYR